jgi:hypothetical protein
MQCGFFNISESGWTRDERYAQRLHLNEVNISEERALLDYAQATPRFSK